jgi:hypothetical protein
MLKKILFASLSAVLLCSSANTSATEESSPETANINSVVGIWAMIPLRSGTADVIEFTQEGESKLYRFNCITESSEEMEISNYAIKDGGKGIHISSKDKSRYLNVLSVKTNSMRLGTVDYQGRELQHAYMKTDKASPLCDLYKEQISIGKSKNTPFTDADFVQNPFVPVNVNMDRYVGKWASEKGAVQIEVKKDSDGRFMLNHDGSGNWHYLFNDVSWHGSELHFQSFAYSEKQELFTHPFHKSNQISILAPVDDVNKIRYSYFIDGKRFNYIYTKKQLDLPQTSQYTASSRAHGASFDLVVTEVKREAQKSYLRVPGFHNRTAPGARWLMCAYTDLAVKRGFSHWSVMYPEEDKDILVVAFSNSASTAPKELFGADFNGARVVGNGMKPVTQLLAFCGMKQK